jgi:hypothetical protein
MGSAPEGSRVTGRELKQVGQLRVLRPADRDPVVFTKRGDAMSRGCLELAQRAGSAQMRQAAGSIDDHMF